MTSTMTIPAALDYIAKLIPTYRSPVLQGIPAWVLTSPAELPEEFRAAQEERRQHYMTTHDGSQRTKPDHAPRYIVTSYGLPIAWVTLDGRTHYTENLGNHADGARLRAIRRHQDAVRAAWPERMGMNRDGEPSPSVPGGMRLTEDARIIPADEYAAGFRTGDRVRDSAGREGTIYTGEAGGFVRVLFDGEREDNLVDARNLRLI